MVQARVRWFDNLYGRILLLFLVTLLPAVFLGSYFYLHTEKTAMTNAEQTVSKALGSAVQEIDQRLEEISVMRELLNNDSQLRSIALSGVNSAENINRMQNAVVLLSKLVVLNDPLFQIALYTGEERVVCSDGIFPEDFYFEEYCRYDGYSLGSWRSLIEQRAVMEYLPTTAMALKGLARSTQHSVLPIVSTFSAGESRGMLLFTLELNSLLRILDQYMPYAHTAFSIGDEHGTTLISTAPTSPKDHAVFVHSSNRNGWHYGAYVARADIIEDARKTLMPVIAIILAALGLGLVLVLLTSRRMYQPLSGIKSRMEAADAKTISGSLMELEKQVDRLMRSSSSDRQYLATLAQSYAETVFLSQAMTEKHAGILSDIMTRLGFHGGPYQCAAVAFTAEDESAAAEKVCGVFNRCFPLCSLRYDDHVMLLIFESGALHTRAMVESVAKEIFSLLPGQVRGITVAGEITDLRQMHNAVNASLTILQRIGPENRNTLLFVEDFDIASQYEYSYRDEGALVEAVQRRDEKALLYQLDAILLKNYEKCVSHAQIIRLFDAMRSTCIRYALQEKVELPVSRPAPYSFNEQREQLYMLYQSLLNMVESKGNTQHAQLAREADAYIQRCYMEDIYLETIADALNVSAKHLSRIYKQQNGINISDQITIVRISHAKRLLSESELPINVVIKRTGFSNRATFLRAFRKYVGLAPSAFRRLHGAGEAEAGVSL